MQIDLSGKNVLITGGTRGIGKAVATKFADAGARVAITFRSSREQADAFKAELEERGTEVLVFQGDASDPAAASEAVEGVVKNWKSLDILINNAGITRDGLMLRMSEDDWDAVINTNLKSVFNFCKAAYRPMMKQRSGKIINMSSIIGVMGNAGQTNYAASKAGIIGLSKSLAKELSSRGVTVNVLAPGYVATEMTAVLKQETLDAMVEAVPLGRAATTEDVAGAALFLGSSLADYITGQVLHVDGGLAM